MKEKRYGILKVSTSSMEAMLELNEECQVLRCFMDERSPYLINVVIESPNIPPIPEGAIIPTYTKARLEGFDE